MPDERGAEHHVVTGMLRRHGRALLVHRSPHRRWYPDAWDLPGGHVEPGEPPRKALQRELREELGITAVVPGECLAQVRGPALRMDIWLVERWEGEPVNLDLTKHDALAWLYSAEMGSLRLADARLAAVVDAALSMEAPRRS